MTQQTQDRRELIAFRVGDQEFCVDIHTVREIRGWAKATPLPHAPAYIQGVINLRGTVLPIVDLGARLGFGPTLATPRHVIIVARIGAKTFGLLVEAVSDILNIADAVIQPTPDVACDVVRGFLRGVIAQDSGMISLLSLDGILPEEHSQEAA
jgi:purine-binding chemotaxis protein CheW